MGSQEWPWPNTFPDTSIGSNVNTVTNRKND
jgi:hypothetical protein